MTMLILGAVIGIAAVALAVFDVFWPITVGLILAAIAAWWLEHWSEAIRYVTPLTVAGYVAIGFVWVFFKWTRLVEKEWRDSRGREHPRPPKWSEHSFDFSAYFFYWPIDVVAFALSDLVQEAWRFISTIVERSFDRYARWRFERVHR